MLLQQNIPDVMACINRVGLVLLLLIVCWEHIEPLKFCCNKSTCMLEYLDLSEDYAFAFAYSNNITSELTALHVTGDVFDLTPLPNLSNLRNFVLDYSQLNSVIVRLTGNKASASVLNTPLKTIIFHDTHILWDVRIDNTLLASIPDTLYGQASLETLFITHSLINSIDFKLFEKLSNLLYLNLSNNKIVFVNIPFDSTCCRRLVLLDLQQNRLDRFNLGLISHMNCLEEFTLRRNLLLAIENYEPYGKPPTLVQSTCTKAFPNRNVKQQKTPSYSRFTSLTSIDLGGNLMQVVNISMFGNMPNLKELMIDRNQLSNVIVTNGLLPMRLEALDLSFNRLANADLRPILSVKLLNIGGNQ
uniref:Leucine rich immune protein (Coil-less) n=1 Tax=Anopheles culicifacies TaxID=139723 RepID=A0A182MMU5_9DIPT